MPSGAAVIHHSSFCILHFHPVLLGVDFDNTIVCYDALFHRVAVERGLIPASVPVNKTDVRDHLRRVGREDEWTELQGVVYGPRIVGAEPYPGVRGFFQAARDAGVATCIISHKTRAPFRGEPHDLHAAAKGWLEQHGFLGSSGAGLSENEIHLELTKAAKLERIAAAGCTHFVDDLPEFLAEPGFPVGVTRVLFDPNDLHRDETRFARATSWDEIRAKLLPANSPAAPEAERAYRKCLASHGFSAGAMLEPLAGGANNRVFKVTDGSRIAVLKAYFQDDADPRDRFGAERAFYKLAWNPEAPRTPEPLAWDSGARLGLFSFVPGSKLDSSAVDAPAVAQALDFFAELNRAREDHTAAIGPGSEACFSPAEHLMCVERRLERLKQAAGAPEADGAFRSFVMGELGPAWETIRGRFVAALHSPSDFVALLPEQSRCLSPSDFGFHNAIAGADGRLRFFDFEYAGWDDPAKLVCDFFCQPQRPVPATLWDSVVRRVADVTGDKPLAVRARQLWPVYQMKWCCILLNEFVRDAAARRSFAGRAVVSEMDRAAQLAKARDALKRAMDFSRSQS